MKKYEIIIALVILFGAMYLGFYLYSTYYSSAEMPNKKLQQEYGIPQ